MAQGWRKRMAVIGAGVMLSSGLIGCMNDKKTVGPPPVSKGSTASTATSGSTPGSTPTWATQTPGSTTPGAAPGAVQIDPPEKLGALKKAGASLRLAVRIVFSVHGESTSTRPTNTR